MNRTPTCQLLVSLMLSTLLLGAASAAEPASSTAASTAIKSDSRTEPRQPNCVRDTGTRIKSKTRDCLGVAGRSYSAEELSRTGQINPADALRRLDPSITGSVR